MPRGGSRPRTDLALRSKEPEDIIFRLWADGVGIGQCKKLLERYHGIDIHVQEVHKHFVRFSHTCNVPIRIADGRERIVVGQTRFVG